ncbi:hypothetical protein ACLB1R_29635 [Escherichia coli]
MHIALKNGSNIALLNAMGHVIIEENLYDKAFVASRTKALKSIVKSLKATRRSRLKISPASAPVRFVRQDAIIPGEKRRHPVGHGCNPVLPGRGNRAFSDQPRDADR